MECRLGQCINADVLLADETYYIKVARTPSPHDDRDGCPTTNRVVLCVETPPTLLAVLRQGKPWGLDVASCDSLGVVRAWRASVATCSLSKCREY